MAALLVHLMADNRPCGTSGKHRIALQARAGWHDLPGTLPACLQSKKQLGVALTKYGCAGRRHSLVSAHTCTANPSQATAAHRRWFPRCASGCALHTSQCRPTFAWSRCARFLLYQEQGYAQLGLRCQGLQGCTWVPPDEQLATCPERVRKKPFQVLAVPQG